MASTPNSSQVVIDGEVFDLVTLPNAESKIVQKAKDSLLGSLDLQVLVEDLGRLGKFIRVAYNGVAGNADVQIKVQGVGYRITKLADKSAMTVHKFKGAAQNVLEELKVTYQHLLDGFEEIALETVRLLTSVAAEMAKAADELHGDFEKAEKDVVEALENLQHLKGSREEQQKTLQKSKNDYEIKKNKAEELYKSALEAEKEATEFYKEAQAREDKAVDSLDAILKTLAGAFTGVVGATASAAAFDLERAMKILNNIDDKTGYKRVMKRANKEKIKHLEEMKKQRDLRVEANAACLEFVQKIASCKNDDTLPKVAIDALHHSIGALKSLSTIMLKAAMFWQQMQSHCEYLAKEDMQEKVKLAMKLPDEKRLNFWTSQGFKESALLYYSKWVALDDVCGVYMLQIRNTREELYKYLEENPTTEQARKNVRQLAEEFASDLNQAQKKLEEDNKKEIDQKRLLESSQTALPEK